MISAMSIIKRIKESEHAIPIINGIIGGLVFTALMMILIKVVSNKFTNHELIKANVCSIEQYDEGDYLVIKIKKCAPQ